MGNFNLDEYITVNERIEKFYKKYPEGSIQTEIKELNEKYVIFVAYAYRTPDDARPGTGTAMEREGSTYINKTSHIENAETSAVGRALAMLGFEIKKAICSREEVTNAINNQPKTESKPITKVEDKEEPKKISEETKDTAHKAWAILLAMTNGDEKTALNKLEELSTWTNKKGEVVKGKRSFKEMSEKQIQTIYGKVKKLYEETEEKPPWEKVVGEER